MLALTTLACLQDGGFFAKPAVDFWGDKVAPSPSVESVFSETRLPPEVLDLLDKPTPENARRYLSIQAERLKKIRKALEAIRAAAVQIDVYTLPGCPACDRQRSELQDAPWTVRWLPPSESIERYPTLVLRCGVGSATLTGFQTREAIRRAMEKCHD